MTTFVALGDSITLGMGDPVPGRGWRCWAALLAEGLPDPVFHNLAASGALSADVAHEQLPRALALRPDLASVVVGINDTLRGGFDPARLRVSVTTAVAALQAAGAVVLTMRLPDPGRMLRLPQSLARPLARRADQVNAVMDEVAARFGTIHFDAACEPETYDRRLWSADRLHPNERGHRLIAVRFHDLLAAAGQALGERPSPEPSSPPPAHWQVLCWMATKGTAWVLRRSRDLLPALLALAAREWWAGTPLAGTLARGPRQRPGLQALVDEPPGHLELLRLAALEVESYPDAAE